MPEEGDHVLTPAYDLLCSSMNFPDESRTALDLFIVGIDVVGITEFLPHPLVKLLVSALFRGPQRSLHELVRESGVRLVLEEHFHCLPVAVSVPPCLVAMSGFAPFFRSLATASVLP